MPRSFTTSANDLVFKGEPVKVEFKLTRYPAVNPHIIAHAVKIPRRNPKYRILPEQISKLLTGLPGETLVRKGIADLINGEESLESLLTLIGAPRLRSLGIEIPEQVIPTRIIACTIAYENVTESMRSALQQFAP